MKKKCYYSVVHYVPNVIRGEYINIGVVIQCREGGVVRCRLLENGEKITRFDQRANPRRTEDMLTDLAQRLNVELKSADIASENFLCELSRTYSNHIQLTPPRLCLAEDVDEELELLFGLFVR